MKCGEPKPGGIYETCDRDLQHSGDHSYFNDRWPRLKTSDPNPDVEALLENTKAANSWALDERRFPIVVIETITRVMWVDAESEDDALAYWADDYTDIDLDGTEVLDGSLDFRRIEQYERTLMTGAGIGPAIACPDCGKQAMKRSWYHDPLRKCHGPIKWRETQAPNVRYRWSREHEAHAGRAVAA